MRDHGPASARRSVPLLDRSALGLLVGLSVLLLVLGKADVRLANYVGERLTDLVVPVLAVLDRPVVGVRRLFDRVGGLLAAHEENARLREENRELLGWQAEAARLAVENRALRRVLAVPAVEHPARALTARIVGDSGGAFVRALLLDAGTRPGGRAWHGGGHARRPGRARDRRRRAQRPHPPDHRLQLAHPRRGRGLRRPRAARGRQHAPADACASCPWTRASPRATAC